MAWRPVVRPLLARRLPSSPLLHRSALCRLLRRSPAPPRHARRRRLPPPRLLRLRAPPPSLAALPPASLLLCASLRPRQHHRPPPPDTTHHQEKGIEEKEWREGGEGIRRGGVGRRDKKRARLLRDNEWSRLVVVFFFSILGPGW